LLSVPASSSCAGANPRLPAPPEQQHSASGKPHLNNGITGGGLSPEQRPNQTEAIQSK
jgi:hypothetical protein